MADEKLVADIIEEDWCERDLTDADLSGADLRNAELAQVDLSNANLAGTKLNDADLRSCRLIGSNLNRAILTKADLSKSDLSGAIMTKTNLMLTHMPDCIFNDANMSQANLTRSVLTRSVFANTNLVKATLTSAEMEEAILPRAKMENANLSKANLTMAKLKNADMKGVNLKGASLVQADLRGADLSNAELSEADFTDADLREVVLDGAFSDDATKIMLPEKYHIKRGRIVKYRRTGDVFESAAISEPISEQELLHTENEEVHVAEGTVPLPEIIEMTASEEDRFGRPPEAWQQEEMKEKRLVGSQKLSDAVKLLGEFRGDDDSRKRKENLTELPMSRNDLETIVSGLEFAKGLIETDDPPPNLRSLLNEIKIYLTQQMKRMAAFAMDDKTQKILTILGFVLASISTIIAIS